MGVSPRFDVVIIGAGIAGICSAYYLATEHNITNCLIIDKRPPLTYTSDKSGSNYRNWWTHPAMKQLADHSINLMDSLSKQSGNSFTLNRRGYVYFRRDGDPDCWLEPYHDAVAGNMRIHRGHASQYDPADDWAFDGADVLVGNSLIQEYAPYVADDIETMAHVRRGGWFSARLLAHHLLDAATEAGAATMTGECIEINPVSDGYELVVEIAESRETIHSTELLLAAGPDLVSYRELLGAEIPVDNIFQQKLMLRDSGTILPQGTPFQIFTDPPEVDWTADEREYIRSHHLSGAMPGNLHIRRVNPSWLHLGWALNQVSDPSRNSRLDFGFASAVVKGMSSFIPSMSKFVDAIPQPALLSGGYYTRTTDNLPIVQKTPSGIFVIGALSGFGIMMGCGVGQIMSDMIAGRDAPDYVRHFSAARYDDPLYVQQIKGMNKGIL